MMITEFFDPHNKEHLKAWKYLNEKGTWPIGFIPDDILFFSGWQYALTNKIVDTWIDKLLES